MARKEAQQGETQATVGATNAQDLVAYQNDSIVSRIVAKQAGGSVTAFAFDGGQSLSEHTTPHDALVCVVEGEVEITISGAAHRLNAGQVILMPANQPHAVRAITRFKMLLTMLKS